jgi:hypothetical protein
MLVGYSATSNKSSNTGQKVTVTDDVSITLMNNRQDLHQCKKSSH